MNRYKSMLKPLLEVVSGHVAAKSASGGVSTKTVNFKMRCILPGDDKLGVFTEGCSKKDGITEPIVLGPSRHS